MEGRHMKPENLEGLQDTPQSAHESFFYQSLIVPDPRKLGEHTKYMGWKSEEELHTPQPKRKRVRKNSNVTKKRKKFQMFEQALLRPRCAKLLDIEARVVRMLHNQLPYPGWFDIAQLKKYKIKGMHYVSLPINTSQCCIHQKEHKRGEQKQYIVFCLTKNNANLRCHKDGDRKHLTQVPLHSHRGVVAKLFAYYGVPMVPSISA